MQTGLNDANAGGPSVFDLPKLEPKQVNERARIWIPDPDRIAMHYVHGIGGKQTQQPGMPEPGWGGNWMCMGNPEVLGGNAPHSDPANCPMCQMVAEGNPYVVKAKRKWLVQVFRYATDPSGAQPLQPFTMGLVVWQFSDKQYRALLEIQKQWGPIRERDLLLTSDQGEFAFKQWSVQVLPDVLFMRDATYIQFMEQAWQTQQVDPEELARIVGRPVENIAEVHAKIAEITPAIAAMGQPGMVPGMAQPGLPPGLPPVPQMPPMAAPPGVPQMPPAAAPAMPAAVAPPAPGQVPTPGLPPAMPPTPAPAEAPGTALPVPPPMPGAGAPAAPGYPQQPPQYAPPAQPGYPPAPQQQYAPPAAAPPVPQMPPAAPQVPQMPPAAPQVPQAAPTAPVAPQVPMPVDPAQQQYAPPPAQPGATVPPPMPPQAVAQPGAPAAAPVADFSQLVAPPAPPAPPA